MEGGDALAELAEDIEERLKALGIQKEDRAFSPHLTLARIRSPVPLSRLRERVQQMQPACFGKFSVSHFSLFQSQTGSNASVYRKLHEYAFESADFKAAASTS